MFRSVVNWLTAKPKQENKGPPISLPVIAQSVFIPVFRNYEEKFGIRFYSPPPDPIIGDLYYYLASFQNPDVVHPVTGNFQPKVSRQLKNTPLVFAHCAGDETVFWKKQVGESALGPKALVILTAAQVVYSHGLEVFSHAFQECPHRDMLLETVRCMQEAVFFATSLLSLLESNSTLLAELSWATTLQDVRLIAEFAKIAIHVANHFIWPVIGGLPVHLHHALVTLKVLHQTSSIRFDDVELKSKIGVMIALWCYQQLQTAEESTDVYAPIPFDQLSLESIVAFLEIQANRSYAHAAARHLLAAEFTKRVESFFTMSFLHDLTIFNSKLELAFESTRMKISTIRFQ